MTSVLAERLRNQKLAGSDLSDPARLVAWFGAIQAQDFQGAKWAVGLRASEVTDAAVERAFNEGAILRTHVLRPTWHFVSAADIRWLIALTGPRVIARLAYRHRQLDLDAKTVARSRALLARALSDVALTRRQAGEVLQRGGIRVTPERLGHLLALHELEGLVCSGPLHGRQFTYALMDHRAADGRPPDREEALARLAVRYFSSHGPAALPDFCWWSGLTLREARDAVSLAGSALSRDAVVNGTYRSAAPEARARQPRTAAWLLPNYDEYIVAYKDRREIFGSHPVHPRDALAQAIVIDGRAAGTWLARRDKETVVVSLQPRRELTADELRRIRRAAARYGVFIGRPVECR